MGSTASHLKALMKKVKDLELTVSELGLQSQGSRKKRFGRKTQPLTMMGMSRALCVDTIDPMKENRVRFYHPTLCNPETPVEGLPWAKPISAMGGFDDSGLSWVPPAGSTICLLFENGHPENAYYIGTMWSRDRGTSGSGLGGYGQFSYPIPEYDRISKGHRGGYLIGKKDESQVLPPWNTESYNGKDQDSDKDFIKDTADQQRTSQANIYGFKTPEKHMLKMVDGNPQCNRRWKRMELLSGCGNWMIFKDDHLHYGGQWAHPDCKAEPGGEDVALCAKKKGDRPYFTDPNGEPIEKEAECEGKSSSSKIISGHPSTPKGTMHENTNKGSNPNFKHENECRPYKGPGTPQNNRCDLPQSGVQIMSIAGHVWVADDSVEEPRGKPIWERSKENFDFGCNDKFLGRTYWKSATGQGIKLSDIESKSKLRGDMNGIFIDSATGSFIHLNDETIGEEGKGCPPNYAGPKRGVHIGSTSLHQINLVDHMNQQCSPVRKEGGIPINKATKAYLNVKSGYGNEMMFNDEGSQTVTGSQWLQLTQPQCAGDQDSRCNSDRGPHFLRFQGRPKGQPGVVFLRAGGHSVRSTYDMDVVLVGDKEKNPADKFTYVSKRHIRATEKTDFRYSGELHILFAEQQILLMAGRDCSGEKCIAPCLYPVVVGRCPWVCPLTGAIHWTEKALSERVFASAKMINCATGEVQNPSGGSPPDCNQDESEKKIDTGAGVVNASNSQSSTQGVMIGSGG